MDRDMEILEMMRHAAGDDLPEDVAKASYVAATAAMKTQGLTDSRIHEVVLAAVSAGSRAMLVEIEKRLRKRLGGQMPEFDGDVRNAILGAVEYPESHHETAMGILAAAEYYLPQADLKDTLTMDALRRMEPNQMIELGRRDDGTWFIGIDPEIFNNPADAILSHDNPSRCKA